MANKDKQLSVRLHGKPVGILEQDFGGKIIFTYLNEAREPLSLSLPLSEEPYIGKKCTPYFGGLLPESEHVRKAIAKKYGISARNDFSLLKAIGYDCAGAVSFHSVDEPVQEHNYIELKGKPLTDQELAGYINDLPHKPLFLGADELRLSLAGVQDKAAICMIDNQVCLPIEGSPTTHILKPAIKAYEGTLENEYMCMRVAKRLGINTPDVEIRKAGDVAYLLVKRHDRLVKQEGLIKRIHQEDFCQALNVSSAIKYQTEGGPNIKDCYDLLKRVTRPAQDTNKLTELILFNFLIGNADAHGKNFSILHYGNGQSSLAPAYDLLSTVIYMELSNKMSMKIGGEYVISQIRLEDWEKLCQETGYSFTQLKKVIQKQITSILPAIEAEIANLKDMGLSSTIGEKILKQVERTSWQLQEQ